LRERALRPLLLLLALLIGVAFAWLTTPLLARRVPNDLSRIGVLLDALHDTRPGPEIVVLGDSEVMCGVDARALERLLPGAPLAWNLASTGQTLAESFLLYQELPESVRIVVQKVSGEALRRPLRLEIQKYTLFHLHGYRPRPETRSVLESSVDAEGREALALSDAQQRWRARWVLRQFVDAEVRRALRPDLALARATHDLFFPQPYDVRLPDAKLARMLDERREGLRSAGEDPVTDEARGLLDAMVRAASAARREIVFLVTPVHPALDSALERRQVETVRDTLAALAQEEGQEIPLVDASGALTSDRFIDARHPTGEGAEIVTGLLARHLATLR
jgi:hypothetical protein